MWDGGGVGPAMPLRANGQIEGSLCQWGLGALVGGGEGVGGDALAASLRYYSPEPLEG